MGWGESGGGKGGGIYCYQSSADITDNIISGNETKSNWDGAGIQCSGGSPAIVGNTVMENLGVGIECSGGSPVIVGNTVMENFGVGIYCSSSSATISKGRGAF